MLLSACTGDLSALDPAGPSARAIAALWWIMLAGSVLIFFATSAVLAFAWYTPRAVGKSATRHLVLWGGLVLPSVVLAILVICAFVLGERLISRSGSDAPLGIDAEAGQWQWQFRYPAASGIVTLDTLHIPVGRQIEFSVTSTDVIHSFWVPRLGGKIDAVPGHRNTILLTADRAGRYGGVCAEFCGEGHAAMTFAVVAHEAADYEAALARVAAGELP